MRRTVTLFLVTWGLAALLTRPAASSAHEWSRLGTIDSLVARGSYDLESSRFHGSSDKIYYRGHYYSHQPPLLPTLEAPVYWVLHRFGLQFWNSAPFDLAYYLFTLLTNGVAFAATVALFDRVLALMAPTASPTLALLLPLGTWLFPYALVSNNHGISAALLMWTTYLLLTIVVRGATVSRLAWLGLSLGLTSAIEIVPAISFLPLVCIAVVSRRDLRQPRPLLAFAVGVLTPLVAHAALNLPLTGDLRPGGFHAELFDYPGSRFTSETLTGKVNHESIAAFLDYSWRALISKKGYFTFAPLLLIGFVAGCFRRPRAEPIRDVQLVLFWGSLLSLGVSLAMTNNFGGVAVGFRHAAYLSPALLTLIVLWADSPGQRRHGRQQLIAAVAAVSAIGMLLFAVPQPWSQLQLPAASPPASWRAYAPSVAFGIDRWGGAVDEFGNSR